MGKDGYQRAVLTPAKMADITQAVRAFCVVYHTGQMYRTDHAAFQSALEERIPAINHAIEGMPALSINFTEGQIRFADRSLEPGSGVFQRVAQTFQELGIENLTFLSGVNADEMTRLITLIKEQPDAIRRDGIAAVLKRENFQTIRSRKPVARGAETVDADDAKASPSPPSPAGSKSGAASSSGVWEISDGDFDVSEQSDEATAQEPSSEQARPPRAIRHFVAGVLGAMNRREADPDEAAAIISTEFEHRLEERVATIRRESEKKIRRLETVKELILAELERMGIAAVIIDANLKVLAMNGLAESILGRVDVATPGSPLERFIRAGVEKQDLTIGAHQRTARLVTVASSGSGSDVMLITLEKTS